MSVQFGNSITVIASTWTAFLATVQAKSLSMQYNDDSTITTVFAFDGPSLVYQCIMWDNATGGVVPPGIIAGGYSQAQNNSDLATFQSTYQANCNQPVGAISATGALAAVNATVTLALTPGVQSVGLQFEAGTLIGLFVAEGSTDNGTTWNQVLISQVAGAVTTTNLKSFGWNFGSANPAFAATVVATGGMGLIRVRMFSYTSGTANVTLRASTINDPSLASFTSTINGPSPPLVAVTAGLTGYQGLITGIARPTRSDRAGTTRAGFDTLLAHDSIEGTTVNSWLWTQSTTTMTIAQALGVLTLNNGGSIASTVDAILTTTRQFPLYNHGVLKFCMKANAVPGPTNAFIELGIGAPSGTTATINNGAFFRLNGTSLRTVTSFNGTENSVTQSFVTIAAGEYYLFCIYVQDDYAHFIVEDASGSPILDTYVQFPTNVPGPAAVSHLPAFARIYNSAAVASAPKLNIGSYDTFMLDLDMEKPWSHQMAATGRTANINPLTFGQTAFLSASAAPATATPANNTCAYATLGGEFILNGTASSENLLGVFGFQAPAPYTLHVTDISLPQPFVTTALGATVNIQEWALMVASSNNPSSATGQRQVLGMFSAAASSVAGTVFNGLPIDMDLGTPIVVLPGQWLLLLVKVISGAASGVYRGSVNIGGYYE